MVTILLAIIALALLPIAVAVGWAILSVAVPVLLVLVAFACLLIALSGAPITSLIVGALVVGGVYAIKRNEVGNAKFAAEKAAGALETARKAQEASIERKRAELEAHR